MRAEELKSLIDKRPFYPIRLHISNGDVIEITHPDAAVVSKSLIFVGLRREPTGVVDVITYYSLLHIAQIEVLGPNDGNGKRRSA